MKQLTRNDLAYGDVLLFTPHKGDIIAQAIAFLTDGKVHHAALCYYEDGSRDDKCVMESLIGQGLVINYLQDKEEITFPAFVARFNKELPLEPVLDVAKRYYEQKNHYPIPNIVILAILLLIRKFPVISLRQKAIYDFLCIVASLLMDYIRKNGHESSMICSQFVAQCFSDVKDAHYDLAFEKLVIFDIKDLNKKDNSLSLLEALEKAPHIQQSNVLSNMYLDEKVVANAFENFKSAIKSAKTHKITQNETAIDSATLSIINVIKQSLDSYFAAHFNVQFSTENCIKLRNYLVTPQDLYANTLSLSIIGYLEYADS